MSEKGVIKFCENWLEIQSETMPKYTATARQAVGMVLKTESQKDFVVEGQKKDKGMIYHILIILLSIAMPIAWVFFIGSLLPEYNATVFAKGEATILSEVELLGECEITYSINNDTVSVLKTPTCSNSETITVYYNPIFPMFNSITPPNTILSYYITFWPIIISIIVISVQLSKVKYLLYKKKLIKNLLKGNTRVEKKLLQQMKRKLFEGVVLIKEVGNSYESLLETPGFVNNFIVEESSSDELSSAEGRFVGIGPRKPNHYKELEHYNDWYLSYYINIALENSKNSMIY